MKMPFGKHKGMPVELLPPSYLHWLIANVELTDPLNQEVRRIARVREKEIDKVLESREKWKAEAIKKKEYEERCREVLNHAFDDELQSLFGEYE